MSCENCCENCYFFDPEDRRPSVAAGVCLRYPTKIRKGRQEWCGEHRLVESEMNPIVFRMGRRQEGVETEDGQA